MLTKITCPKCNHAAIYWKWCVWTDLSGRKLKCPSCKSLFSFKWVKFSFLNKPFGNALFEMVLGLLILMAIILLAEVLGFLFSFSLWMMAIGLIVGVAGGLIIAGHFYALVINKYCVLKEIGGN